jgi:Flp pilus assembly pilin Flp
MPELFKREREFLRQSAGAFWRDEDGQDLIEYTLLMAFVCLSTAALFVSAGTNVSRIWSSANVTLSTAVVRASS